MFVTSVNVCVGVLPPFTGGLHCGPAMLPDLEAEKGVLPPSDGGLHCGYETATAQTYVAATRSRRSPAGSIVASTAGCPAAAGPGFPPAVGRWAPLRLRQITRVPAHHLPAPAVQRRAPFRRFELQAHQRVRPVCSRRSTAGSNVATSMCERHHENCHGPVNRLSASAIVVTPRQGSARTQVSARFLHLDKSIERNPVP